MGRGIRAVRRKKSPNFLTLRQGKHKSWLPAVSNYKAGTLKCTIRRLHHDIGRGAAMAELKYGTDKRSVVVPEGCYEGQEIDCGDNAPMKVGNILPIGKMIEGTQVCNLERKFGDGGKVARASGIFAVVVGHDAENKTTRVRLPSREKLILPSNCRAMLGVVSSAGRVDKPLLKAGNAFHKYKNTLKVWPRVRGTAMNPVDHPHGGGNHQHVGKPTTISKHTHKNARVGLVGARRSGRKR
eukprot:GHVN01046991.1.p1 GENE.GHVN01046991.1~~GHVN01046991.1.p1  ORF type:complete len:240 (+),score=16.75 GHVN01046991.1:2-721(+)